MDSNYILNETDANKELTLYAWKTESDEQYMSKDNIMNELNYSRIDVKITDGNNHHLLLMNYQLKIYKIGSFLVIMI